MKTLIRSFITERKNLTKYFLRLLKGADNFIYLRKFQYREFFFISLIRRSYFFSVIHFILLGQYELKYGLWRLGFNYKGRYLEFVEEYYLKANPDVVQLISQGKVSSAAQHFVRRGYKEVLAGTRILYPESATTRLLRKEKLTAKTSGRHICFFAHYDCQGLIDEYVLEYLDRLRELDCDIVFVSGSAKPTELHKIAGRCLMYLERDEGGRDFGSWYLALKHANLNLSTYDYMIWANDSVYFPVRPVSNLIQKMKERKLDYWGITDSIEEGPKCHSYHIQSYFLAFSQKARSSGLIEAFIERYEKHDVLSKKGQIVLFEYGLSQIAMSKNLQIGALCTIEDLHEFEKTQRPNIRAIQMSNPTIDLWDTAIGRFNCPALKVELVKKRLVSQVAIDSVIGAQYDASLVWNHTLRTAGKVYSYYKDSSAKTEPVQLRQKIVFKPLAGLGRLCFFAHYDKDAKIHDYVLTSLKALRELKIEIIFITTTDNADELEKLRGFVNEVLIKNNSGRDFGSWWLAMADMDPVKLSYDTYLLMNDSIYFPLADPNQMFVAMANYDFWGVAESFQHRWHVMSFFWAFKTDCYLKFREHFIQDFSPFFGKWDQIRNYELRYPSMLRELGFNVGAYVTCEKVRSFVLRNKRSNAESSYARDLLFNMNHPFWDIIIEKFNCPTLKIDLVRDNPTGVKTLGHLKDFIETKTSYDFGNIERHQCALNMGPEPIPNGLSEQANGVNAIRAATFLATDM